MSNKYLLSSTRVEGVTNITYDTSLPKEKSFISLAATLIPMTIMLDYYLEGNNLVLSSTSAEIGKMEETIEIFKSLQKSN